MNLKNYTSSVPAETTIARIEAYLVAVGASSIGKKVNDGQVEALIFEIKDERNIPRTIKLPANVNSVRKALWSEYATTRTRRVKEESDFSDQAARTAWRLVQDWIQVQVSMIKLKQVEMLEVFMPYIWDGEQTYYQYLREHHFKALPAPKGE